MDTKKIGILTFHRAINYGAVLQTFALQNYVLLAGKSQVYVIDFFTRIQEKSYYKYKRFPFGVKKIIFYLLFHYHRAEKRKQKFDKFVAEKLILSPQRYKDELEFLTNPPKYDIVISGSDQVFNPKNKYRKVYYLDYLKRKGEHKISYAASLGVDSYSSSDEIDIKRMLSDFDALSCRELQGTSAIQSLGLSVNHVFDPVFLFDNTEWTCLLRLNKYDGKYDLPEKYIFVYDLNGGSALINKAKQLSLLLGYPIYCLTYNLLQRYHVKKIYYNLGPEEFLYFISHASFILTDSFHGTAFSIIFRKPFFSYIAMKSNSSRLSSLLNTLGLMDRLIEYETAFEDKTIDICYGAGFDEKFNQHITVSKSFLKSNIYG